MVKIPLDQITVPSWGWHLPDPNLEHKLEMSLSRFGQLRPLTVRVVDNGYEIVDGRHVLAAMKRLGWDAAACVVVEGGVDVALALALEHEVDYVSFAAAVAPLPDEVVSTAPFTGVQLRHYRTLSRNWDWSMYEAGVEQTTFFDDEEDVFEVTDVGTYTKGDHPDPEEDQAPPTPRPAKSKPQPPARPPRPNILDLLEDTLVEAAAAPAPAPVQTDAAARLAKLLEDDAPAPAPAPPASPVGAATRRDPEVPAPEPFPEPPEPLVEAPTASKTPDFPRPRVEVVDTPRPSVLQALAATVSKPRSSWTPPEPPSLDGVKEVEFDTEADGVRWWAGNKPIGISINVDGNRSWYLPWGHHGGGNLDEATVKRWAQRELRGKHITGANTRFDIHMMRAWGIDLEEQGCTFSDVQHQAALLDEYRRKFNLEGLCEDFLPETRKLGQDLDKEHIADYHAGEVARYAEVDVESVTELKKVFKPRLDAEDLQRVRSLEDRVIPVVVEMEKNAALIDRPRLKRWVQRSKEVLNEYMWALSKELNFPMNPDKNEDWQRLFNHYGIPITSYTENGAPSFTDTVLAAVNHPMVQMARRAGKIASLRSKFLVAYDEVIGDDCILRFALHQLRGDDYGTIRGRFSMSSGGKGEGKFGANLQQVFAADKQRETFGVDANDASHDDDIFLIRALFIPHEDGVYLGSDAQSIEYRLAAHFAASPKLMKAYEEDWKKLKDPKLQDGKWVDFHQVVQDIITPHKRVTRKTTKNLNFMKIYGGGRDKAAATLGMTRAESDPIIDLYDKLFPEFAKLLKNTGNRAQKQGYVTTLMGRRARFNSDKFLHAALNYVVQGSAADIMKQKLVELHEQRKYTGFVMRQTVHDEVDGDAMLPETEERVREILNRQSFDLRVPIIWKVKLGINWASV